MSDQDQERKAPLKLSQPGKLELKKTVESGQVRQSFSHGRSKVVTVEVRKKRTFTAGAGGAMHEIRDGAHSGAEAELAQAVANVEAAQRAASAHDLTNHEKLARANALEHALKAEEDARIRAEEEAQAAEARRIEEENRAAQEAAAAAEEAAKAAAAAAEEAAKAAAAAAAEQAAPVEVAAPIPVVAPAAPVAPVVAPVSGAATLSPPSTTVAPGAAPLPGAPRVKTPAEEDEEEGERARKRIAVHKPAPVKRSEPRRKTGKLTITAALDEEDRGERGRSLASVRRAREREPCCRDGADGRAGRRAALRRR